jgi:hypothetical protein
MAETLTPAQIAALRSEGADISFDEDTRRKIEGFNELIAQIKELVAAQRASAGADMDRSAAQSQLIELMQKLMSRPVADTDMSIVAEALTEISAMRMDRTSYEFTVVRDNNGFMQQIVAVPITPTQH